MVFHEKVRECLIGSDAHEIDVQTSDQIRVSRSKQVQHSNTELTSEHKTEHKTFAIANVLKLTRLGYHFPIRTSK